MATAINIQADATGWQTFSSYTPTGGKIFVLRSFSLCSLNAHGVLTQAHNNSAWRVLLDGSPVTGLDDLCINPDAGFPSFNCFVIVPSNRTLLIQLNLGAGGVNVGDKWLARMYGNLLESQNTLPAWEPCNLEGK